MKFSVIIPTWRLGVDVVLEALARQTYWDFEVILVDGLFRWRRTMKWPRFNFPIKHIPVEDSLMPVVCHARFRNTGIRAAVGDRMVFLADYAAPPPEFLSLHAALPENAIGITSYRLYAPLNVKYPHPVDDFWAVVEEAIKGTFLYSVFDGTPMMGEATSRYPTWHPFTPTTDPVSGFSTPPYPAHYVPHWKCDSVSSATVRLVNGWDLAYDGTGNYGDADFALRLLRAGAVLMPVNIGCPIVDMHETMQSIITDRMQGKCDADNLALLQELEAFGGRSRCRQGLVSAMVPPPGSIR